MSKKGKEFDAKKFLKMASDKASPEDFLKTFGFKTKARIEKAHYIALVKTGALEPVIAGRVVGKAVKIHKVKVGKKGSINISKELVAEFAFPGETEFTIKKRGANIITLKKVEP